MRISLDQLTVLEASPSEYADMAVELGYDAISPFPGGDTLLRAHWLKRGDAETEAMNARLKAGGVFVNNLDGMIVQPEMDWDALARMIDIAGYIGARRGTTLIYDPEASRAFYSFCRIAEMTRAAGLGLVLEFAPLSHARSIEDAAAYIARSGQDVGILVDLLHLAQSGGTPADIAKLDPRLIVCAQFCDGPRAPDTKQYRYNALYERQVPGDGQLPVREFLQALPDHTVIGLEVPLKTLTEQGMSARDRARMLLERTRTLLAEIGR